MNAEQSAMMPWRQPVEKGFPGNRGRVCKRSSKTPASRPVRAAAAAAVAARSARVPRCRLLPPRLRRPLLPPSAPVGQAVLPYVQSVAVPARARGRGSRWGWG